MLLNCSDCLHICFQAHIINVNISIDYQSIVFFKSQLLTSLNVIKPQVCGYANLKNTYNKVREIKCNIWFRGYGVVM